MESTFGTDPLSDDIRVKNTSWTRRRFFKTLVWSGVAVQVAYFPSCSVDRTNTRPLSKKQFSNLQSMLSVLFPEDGNGPGALRLQADQYILWVLNDPRMSDQEKDFIKMGLTRLEEQAKSTYGSSFHKLEAEESAALTATLTDEKWGENWMSLLLTYVIEALISDPIYGFNENGIGWDWLGHVAGIPRPTDENKYDAIFETVKRNA